MSYISQKNNNIYSTLCDPYNLNNKTYLQKELQSSNYITVFNRRVINTFD